MSSDISSASYALDYSGIKIKFDLKNHTSNIDVTTNSLSLFTNITDSFSISNYSNYDMISLKIIAIT